MAHSEFAKKNKNRPDKLFERPYELKWHYRNTIPPVAYVRDIGFKKPGVIFCNEYMCTLKAEKSEVIHKHVTNRGHSFIRFDYTDHGDSFFNKKTANEPIDEKNVLSPFPGPRQLKNEEKLLDFKMWKTDIINLMDEYTEGPQVLIGDGMGAWLALLVAIERPEKVKGVVALSTGVDMMARYMNCKFDDREKERIQAGETVWIQDCPDGPYVGTKKIVEDSREFDLLPREGKLPVRCPVRFCHCMEDDLIPYHWMKRLANKLASQDVEVYLKKCGDHRMSTEKDYEIIFKAIDSILTLF